MVTEERPERLEETTTIGPGESPVGLDGSGEFEEMASTGSQQIAPVETRALAVPKGVSDLEDKDLKNRATILAKQLEDASGSKELEMIDSISSLGVQAQRNAGTQLELLRTRVGEMLAQEGPSNEISKDLIELRAALNQINPHELSEAGFMSRLIRKLPLVGNPALKALERVAVRYEPVSKQVGIIEGQLREGRAMLARDNVELRKLYEQVEAQQLPVQKNAYLGELMMQQLDDVIARTDDPLRTERVRNALHDVSMRVQDLRTMEEVHIQFFVSIEMTRQNNTRLGQSVERTLALGTNVVMVGLAIQSALTRQRRVLEATERTREFLGNLIVANAASIKQHTTDIGNVYNNPVIAIDKITQAHNDLIEAMDTADRLKQEGIDSARQNIAKLKDLSSDLQRRSQGLIEQREAEPRSIEA